MPRSAKRESPSDGSLHIVDGRSEETLDTGPKTLGPLPLRRVAAHEEVIAQAVQRLRQGERAVLLPRSEPANDVRAPSAPAELTAAELVLVDWLIDEALAAWSAA